VAREGVCVDGSTYESVSESEFSSGEETKTDQRGSMGQKGEAAAALLSIVVGRAALGFGFGRRIPPFL
jgi:hypothetical protein